MDLHKSVSISLGCIYRGKLITCYYQTNLGALCSVGVLQGYALHASGVEAGLHWEREGTVQQDATEDFIDCEIGSIWT